MTRFSNLWRNLTERDRVERDLDDEVRGSFDLLVDEKIKAGSRPEDARRAARLELGGIDVVKEQVRDARAGSFSGTVLQDLRLAARTLARDCSFALLVIVTLVVGIGSATAVFSVIHSVLLRPLPYEDPDRLVAVRYRSADPYLAGQVPSSSYDAWSAASRSVQSFGALTTNSAALITIGDEHLEITSGFVSPSFFRMLGGSATPAMGRLLDDADYGASAPPVAILSHAFWRGPFRGDPSILGRDVSLNGRPYIVVGIVSPDFRFPAQAAPDVLVPLTTPGGRGVVIRYFSVIGRLRGAVTPEAAELELITIDSAARDTYPAAMRSLFTAGAVPEVVPLQRHIAGDLRDVLIVALAVVGVVFLTACANVAGLLLARAASRRPELAMRAALGATPRRLVQTVLAEALLLAVIGAAAAGCVVYLGREPLRELVAGNGPRSVLITIDWSVLAFTAVLGVVAAVLASLLPTVRLLRTSATLLPRPTASGSIRAAADEPMRRVLVAGQMAAAITLLTGALLLLNTFWRLAARDLGFETENVLTFRISLVGSGYSPVQRHALANDLFARLEAIPGIASAGGSTALPLGGQAMAFSIPIEGEAPSPDAPPTAVDLVSPGYFHTLGIAMTAGREFNPRDGAGAPPVAIVNEAFVRERLRRRDALGRRIALGGGPQDATITIVGVVRDVSDRPRVPVSSPHVYRPFDQAAPQIGWSTVRGAVRAASGEIQLAETVRREVALIAKQAAVYDFAMMSERVSASITSERHRTVVFGMLAAAAVVLAGIGLYGLLAYFVLQSRHELGVRLALGASKSGLVRLIVRRALGPVLVGIGIGAIGSFWFARALENLLYGVRPIDPATFAAAAAGLLLVAVAATCVPAWRAAQADPMVALRSE